MPDWRDEVTQAVTQWLNHEGGAKGQARWRLVGRATGEGAEGWYQVDLRGAKVSEAQLERLRLGGPRAPESGGKGAEQGGDPAEISGLSVQDSVFDGEILRVRVAQVAELTDPHLWAYQQPPNFLIEALRDGFASMAEPGLAHVLARGELNGTPGPDLPGRWRSVLLPAQQRAFRAALGKGVWLVWGPPGTGKTEVLHRSISQLIEQGKRVLLVSATNIAVDNALARVVGDWPDPQPGLAVRVGTPQLPEVMANAAVSLPQLVRAKLDEVERERGGIEAEIRPLRERAEELAACDVRIAGFDFDAYLAAAEVVGPRMALREGQLRGALREAVSFRVQADKQMEHAQAAVLRAGAGYGNTQSARDVWGQVDALVQGVEAVDEAAVAAEASALLASQAVSRYQYSVTEWSVQSAFRRRRTRDEGERLQAQLAAAVSASEHRRQVAADARATAAAFRDQSERQAAELTAAAQYSRGEIGRREASLQAAQEKAGEAQARQSQQVAAHEAAQDALVHFFGAAKLVDAEAHTDRPALAVRASVLRPRVAADAARYARLAKDYLAVEAKYEQLSRDAAGEIIRDARLVATTLARFRTNRAVFDGPYDAVFVDEISAATLPEVLLAVARAGSMAMLLGDFMQLGSVGVDEAEAKIKQPLFTKWVLPDVFGHCHIASPEQAAGHPQCITLDVQHRFGLDVMDLANQVAYGGLLQAGELPLRKGRGTADDPQVVVVDTDGLGDLEQIYRKAKVSGWWTAGALLSRAIADLHAGRGEKVGIVTPYTPQVEATLEALRDLERADGVQAEVGTAHRFQGREFPVVVFDTVENRDAQPAGWVARARSGPGSGSWDRDGVRLFNVATTRAKETLYIIASRSRIEAAGPGTAFAHLRGQLAQGHALCLPAARFVNPGLEIPQDYGALGAGLAESLARHVEVVDIDDERTFYENFAPRVRAASQSIWLWAPWATQRSKLIAPDLVAAQDRGVRVVVFTRGPEDPLHQTPGADGTLALAELRRSLPGVVVVRGLHQKIAVFDEQVVLYGSLNILSSRPAPGRANRETMMTLNGRALARRLLAAEHAEKFARPRSCGACGGDDGDLRRLAGQRTDGWWWSCLNHGCPERRGTKAWRQRIEL
jgi:AAA domain